MTAIPRKYITDAKNQKQAVIVDLETFNRRESIIEDNGLAKFMEEAEEDETLTVHEAKKHYRSLKILTRSPHQITCSGILISTESADFGAGGAKAELEYSADFAFPLRVVGPPGGKAFARGQCLIDFIRG